MAGVLVAGLAGYEAVSGNLFVEGTTLADFTGLECLASVGGGMWIVENDSLANLQGLNALTSVGDNLTFELNVSLTSLDGLDSLTELGGALHIEYNLALTNLDGPSALTSVGDYFSVFFNDVLPDCEVCELLDQLTTGPTSTICSHVPRLPMSTGSNTRSGKSPARGCT